MSNKPGFYRRISTGRRSFHFGVGFRGLIRMLCLSVLMSLGEWASLGAAATPLTAALPQHPIVHLLNHTPIIADLLMSGHFS